MRWFTADLHIHSVLSPCGGLEMSPRELIARIKACGIDWMAITDHNSLANCEAYDAVAKKAGIAFTWGVEAQTLEEIHLQVYFDDPLMAQKFGSELYNSLLPIENDPDFFGDQVIIDENENILGMEHRALINSSTWDLNAMVQKAREFGGYCVPAHVDAGVNSLLSQLGFIPAEPEFDLFGLTAQADLSAFLAQNGSLSPKAFLRCSDAHYLDDIGTGISRIYVREPSAAELAKAAKGLDERKIVI
jgi:PHP family Zn ribbon phosphoesterase